MSHEEVMIAGNNIAPLSAHSIYEQNEISQEISSPCNEQVVGKTGLIQSNKTCLILILLCNWRIR